MSRKSQSEYVETARTVLEELGGSLSSKALVVAAAERGMIDGDNKWTYHYLLKAVRTSALFDTSRRGYVSLVEPVSEEASEVNVVAEGDGTTVVDSVPPEVFADPADTGTIMDADPTDVPEADPVV